VRERRHAEPDGVQLLAVEHRRPVGVAAGADAGRGHLGALAHRIGDRHDLDVVEAGERGQVPAGDEPGADHADAQPAHRRASRSAAS
jgi:hypothetical protein